MEQDFKDYYAVLGVSPDADDKTIKQTYRKLARQYHPDVNPGDATAEDRFKEINEAYQVLGDSEKRREYDTLRDQYEQWQRMGQQRGGFDYRQYAGGGAGGAGGAGGGVYTQTVSPEDLHDMFGSDSPYSDFFRSVFGGRMDESYTSAPRPGRSLELEATITLEEAFHGTRRSIQVGERRIEATIPRGVRTGSKVRLAGQGSPGVNGAPAGDLYLVIAVEPDDRFARDGDDLTVTVDVDVFTALLGGSVRVPTFEGTVRLKVPPYTNADQRIRLRGKGMPHPGNPEQRGDLFARVRLVLPATLSDDDLATIRTLTAAQPSN